MDLALFFCLTLQLSQGAQEGPIVLAKPEGLEMSVGEALRMRHSVRKFDPTRQLSRTQLGTLLWASAGVTRPEPTHPVGGKRTAPSAFGSASVDVFVTSAEGTFVYSSKDHALVPHGAAAKKDLRADLAGAAWAKEAPVLMLFVANLERYPEKTSTAERRDYSFADASAAGENLYLACTALGLGTCLTMSSNKEAGALLGLSKSQVVLFAFPVGYPAEAK